MKKFFIIFTIFIAIFAGIYEHFGNGVYSNAMIFAFLYPLLMGFVPFLIISLTKKKFGKNEISGLLYSFGVITLTVGSIFKGVLEIYGTTNRLLPVYYYAGGILIAIGLATMGIRNEAKKTD